MNKNTPSLIAAVIIGILFLIIAFLYFTKGANELPSFLPGHDALMTAKHIKHGIGALLLGIACFVLAWFQTGTNDTIG